MSPVQAPPSRQSIRGLGIILGSSSAALFALAFLVPSLFKDLFINLSAGLVVALLTVFGVDRVLQLQKKAEWAGVEARVNQRLLQLGTATISSVRDACRYEADILNQAALTSGNLVWFSNEMIRVAEQILAPTLSRIQALNQAGWQSYIRNLQNTSMRTDQLLGIFKSDLPADIVQVLLDLQTTAEGIIANFQTFPDIYGVSPSQLPRRRDGSGTEDLQHWLQESAIKSTGILLRECVAMLTSLKLKDLSTV